jgi:hypothetical protein
MSEVSFYSVSAPLHLHIRVDYLAIVLTALHVSQNRNHPWPPHNSDTAILRIKRWQRWIRVDYSATQRHVALLEDDILRPSERLCKLQHIFELMTTLDLVPQIFPRFSSSS